MLEKLKSNCFIFISDQKVYEKEPIWGYNALQDLIQKNLFYITGRPLVSNQSTQVEDTGMLAKLQELTKKNEYLQSEIEEYSNYPK
jgi:hypothetical protein